MKALEFLNRASYAVCLLAVAVGAATAITAIWIGADDELAWKGFATAVVMFGAGLLTIVVNKAVGVRVIDDAAPALPASPMRVPREPARDAAGGTPKA